MEVGVRINLSRLLKITMGDQCLAEACWSLSMFSWSLPKACAGPSVLCGTEIFVPPRQASGPQLAASVPLCFVLK